MAMVEEQRSWPDADLERLDIERENTLRKRALAVSIRAGQDGVRLGIQREHGTGDEPVA